MNISETSDRWNFCVHYQDGLKNADCEMCEGTEYSVTAVESGSLAMTTEEDKPITFTGVSF